MKQYGLLAAAFGGTLAVLLVAFLVIEQLGSSGGPTAGASASPSPSAVAIATTRPSATPVASIAPTAVPSVAPSASAAPTPTPATATPRPTPAVGPSVAPGKTIQVVVRGAQYVDAVVAQNAKVTQIASGGVLISSDRTYSDQTTVTWKLPVSSLPAGTRIARLDVAVCGSAEGDFWETYGPPGTEPVENEVTPPASDGCWHYLGGSGRDSTVTGIIHLESKLWIDRLVYTITPE